MPSWWVNHKQTYREETDGGYIWSPKQNQNGARNQTYDNMASVEPGDFIFSYANQLIQQVGVASDRGITSTKPAEFGSKGENWNANGWLVPVEWQALQQPLRPKTFIAEFVSLLPEKHSPLSADGDGRQNVYLAAISDQMSRLLLSKIPERVTLGSASAHVQIQNPIVEGEEDQVERAIVNNTAISSTEKLELIKARRGQGRFRQNLEGIEGSCRITGVTDRRLLRASHIKPWRLCETNHERLDGHNGLLLTPTVDLLFDHGYISFSDEGNCLIADRIAASELALVGLSNGRLPAKAFNETQRVYLRYHRRLFSFVE
ncbi:HNH endonuclease signature motif containing protein [Mesorhizobium sp. M0586]|uniref:HNH endonuclease n=1 Tax=unclassified Mesorhizobium TaxID=325217 RepID=UPI00333D2FBF